jgi:hypothetical protein
MGMAILPEYKVTLKSGMYHCGRCRAQWGESVELVYGYYLDRFSTSDTRFVPTNKVPKDQCPYCGLKV